MRPDPFAPCRATALDALAVIGLALMLVVCAAILHSSPALAGEARPLVHRSLAVAGFVGAIVGSLMGLWAGLIVYFDRRRGL